MLSNCTRGSVRLSVVLRSRLRVTPPPHRTVPLVSVTWMNELTNSTISVPLVAAFGSGGTPHPLHDSVRPSKLLEIAGATFGGPAAGGGTLRAPVVGRDGRRGPARRWNSSIRGLGGGAILASGALAASLKSTTDTVETPTPPERRAGAAAAGRAMSANAAIASQPAVAKMT